MKPSNNKITQLAETTRYVLTALLLGVVLVSCGGGGGGGSEGGNPTPSSMTTTVIDSTGGSATSADSNVTIQVPAGAVATSTAITISPSTANAPQGNIGGVVDFGPDGATFSTPVTISMSYDPALIPQGITESSLTLAFVSGLTWTDIPTTVDTVNKLLIGQTTHFSAYAPTIAAPSKLSYGTLIGNFNGVNVSSNGSPKYVSNSYNTNNTGTYNSGMTWQCVEFVNRYYYQTYGKEIRIPGQNANLYYQQASARGLVAYPNGGSVSPQVGDIIVSEGNGIDLVAEANGTDNNVGHVAIVRAVSPDKIHLVEQNWFQNQGDLDHVLAITSGNKVAGFSPSFPVKGWLRMPTGGGAAAPPPPAIPASPTVILNASPSSIASGATTTLGWTSIDSTSCNLLGIGGIGATGSYTTPSLTTTTTYTVTCTGAGGTASQSVTVTVAAPTPILFNVAQLFSESWTSTGQYTELSAISYDPVSDNLFFIKSIHNVPNNEVRRYSFGTGQITTVFSYPSQWDYGLRIFGSDLYVVQTYDNSILRLTNLAASTLTQVGRYPASYYSIALNEINDIAVLNGNIYFVAGNMLTSTQHNGIQYLQGPDYNATYELLSSANSGWPDPNYVNARAIISIGSGTSAKFVIATGDTGNIELRDVSGNLLISEVGFGNSYLQKDSADRIYAVTGFGNNTKITRWSANLVSKEEFFLNSSQIYGNSIRFVLRETASNIEVIMAEYRASSPLFYKTTIPK